MKSSDVFIVCFASRFFMTITCDFIYTQYYSGTFTKSSFLRVWPWSNLSMFTCRDIKYYLTTFICIYFIYYPLLCHYGIFSDGTDHQQGGWHEIRPLIDNMFRGYRGGHHISSVKRLFIQFLSNSSSQPQISFFTLHVTVETSSCPVNSNNN